MKFRQVHLDFHTSPCIPGIGERFSKAQFADALKEGHVNSITLFSKCHHGYSYHPTRVNEMHPGLSFDLLGEELAVCRECGVNAPVYISAGFDEKDAVAHPEWLNVPAPDAGLDFVNEARYHVLCYNTAYLDKLCAEVEEVMAKYNPVGIFLDISDVRMCYCARCRADMQAKGLDIHNPADVHRHGEEVYAEYCRRIEQSVRKYSATATIFHNAGNITRGRRDIAGYNTHFELESLPTGGWGYDHFPMSAAYVRTLGKDYLGMTGKFHTAWGEFGGFKHPNALRYEAALSIALGAKCSIGDQMHPSGEMNLSTYRLIGKAYSEVEAKEKWCENALAVSDIAVLSAEAAAGKEYKSSDVGACRMLLEGKFLFDIIDLETPFDAYKLILLPDYIPVDEALAARLNAFTQNGGKLLVTGNSGQNSHGDFAIDLGAERNGKCAFKPTYMVPTADVPTVNGVTQYVFYSEATEISPSRDSVVFAYRANPYFNRTPEHFSSHQHTPDVPDDRHPAAVLGKNTAYIGWNICEDYAQKGSLCLKELFLYAVNALIGNSKTVAVTGLPDRGIVTVTVQPAENREIVHLLFAHTCLRGERTEVIEDIVPVYNIGVSLKVSKKPVSVKLVPEAADIPFSYQDTGISFTVEKLWLHSMIEVRF